MVLERNLIAIGPGSVVSVGMEGFMIQPGFCLVLAYLELVLFLWGR